MKQREKLKSRLEAEAIPDSDEVKNLRAEIERLKAQSPTPGDKGLKQKMAKLQKSWKAKIDEAESKLASAQAKNEELLDQLASLSPTPQSDRDPVDHFQLAKAQRRIEELTELVEKYKGDADKRALINEQLITDNENLSGLGLHNLQL